MLRIYLTILIILNYRQDDGLLCCAKAKLSLEVLIAILQTSPTRLCATKMMLPDEAFFQLDL